jgi:hypothetical protein
LCRYISRLAILEKCLWLTTIGDRLYPKFTCSVLLDVELTAPRRMPTPRITRIEKAAHRGGLFMRVRGATGHRRLNGSGVGDDQRILCCRAEERVLPAFRGRSK